MNMRLVLTLITLLAISPAYSQDSTDLIRKLMLDIIKENTCKCIDSISVSNKPREVIAEEASACIKKRVLAYQIIPNSSGKKDSTGSMVVTINSDEDSKQYQAVYIELERILMESCPSLKAKLASNNETREKSFSRNKKALDFYSKGVDASQAGDNNKAVNFFKKAVEADPEFAFAWDNLGLCYRKLGEYEKALEAYQQSLKIDPNGQMPLQNIAIVYSYQKEYQKAIDAYLRLAELNKDNPEIYYGVGSIYLLYLNEPEKALDNLCQAYNLYIIQKSPYRTDAETLINKVYGIMKKDGKEEKFFEILKSHNIQPN